MQPEQDAVEENWQAEPEKPMALMSIKQLEQLISQCYQERDEIQVLETQIKEKEKLHNNTKQRILSVFQEFNKSNYSSHRGMLIRQRRFNVTMPKDPKKRSAFFGYLKERDTFESLITVNAQSLNSYYKAEMDVAAKSGKPFEIPGLDAPKYFETLSIRTKR